MLPQGLQGLTIPDEESVGMEDSLSAMLNVPIPTSTAAATVGQFYADEYVVQCSGIDVERGVFRPLRVPC